jgi:hypothetical protein
MRQETLTHKSPNEKIFKEIKRATRKFLEKLNDSHLLHITPEMFNRITLAAA